MMALLDIRLWTLRFEKEYARRLRCTRAACSNIWHLDEFCLVINGECGWLWRAVDDGARFSTSWSTPPELTRREAFFRKLLKELGMEPVLSHISANG